MDVRDDGARVEQKLELDGHFVGFRLLPAGAEQLGVVLVTPDDGCGTSQLKAIAFGRDPANASEPLAIASTLELPSDRWAIADAARGSILLRRDFVYVLVRAGTDGALSVVSSGSLDVGVTNEQLLGTSLYAGAGPAGIACWICAVRNRDKVRHLPGQRRMTAPRGEPRPSAALEVPPGSKAAAGPP